MMVWILSGWPSEIKVFIKYSQITISENYLPVWILKWVRSSAVMLCEICWIISSTILDDKKKLNQTRTEVLNSSLLEGFAEISQIFHICLIQFTSGFVCVKQFSPFIRCDDKLSQLKRRRTTRSSQTITSHFNFLWVNKNYYEEILRMRI